MQQPPPLDHVPSEDIGIGPIGIGPKRQLDYKLWDNDHVLMCLVYYAIKLDFISYCIYL